MDEQNGACRYRPSGTFLWSHWLEVPADVFRTLELKKPMINLAYKLFGDLRLVCKPLVYDRLPATKFRQPDLEEPQPKSIRYLHPSDRSGHSGPQGREEERRGVPGGGWRNACHDSGSAESEFMELRLQTTQGFDEATYYFIAKYSSKLESGGLVDREKLSDLQVFRLENRMRWQLGFLSWTGG